MNALLWDWCVPRSLLGIGSSETGVEMVVRHHINLVSKTQLLARTSTYILYYPKEVLTNWHGQNIHSLVKNLFLQRLIGSS